MTNPARAGFWPDFQIDCNYRYIIYTHSRSNLCRSNVNDTYYVSNLIFDREKSIRYSRPRISVVWDKRLFKSHETIRLLWDFCRSRIWKKCWIPAGAGAGAEIRYSPNQSIISYCAEFGSCDWASIMGKQTNGN